MTVATDRAFHPLRVTDLDFWGHSFEEREEVFRTLKTREREMLTTLLIKVIREIHPEALELYRDRRAVFPPAAE